MQEVSGFLGGELDYVKLKGDTGPLVYPAGFVYLYSLLFWSTSDGENIMLAQFYFAVLYILFQALVMRVFKTANTLPWFAYFLLCISKRIHSIFMLRLFNDCWAMFLLYGAILSFIKNKWSIGCLLFSFAVSVKMNVLLFAPGVLVLLLYKFGLKGTFWNLCICASSQIAIALPFLLTHPLSYMHRAFDFGRQFVFHWSVNWKFVEENVFLSKHFALGLLLMHLSALFLLWRIRWKPQLEANSKISPKVILDVLFTCNFAGIMFARSLHYQFYVWYFHSLVYMLWSTSSPGYLINSCKLILLLSVEYCWNVFPSTSASSFLLFVCHLILLGYLLLPPGKLKTN